MNILKNKLIVGFLAMVLILSLGLGGLVYYYGHTYEKTAMVYMKNLDWVLPLSTNYQHISIDKESGNLYRCLQKDTVDFRNTDGEVVETQNLSDETEVTEGNRDSADFLPYEYTGNHKGWTTYKGREIHAVWRVDQNTYAVSFEGETPEESVSDFMLFDEKMNPVFGERLFANILRESDGMRYFVSSERNFDGTPAKQEWGFMNDKGEMVFTFDHEPLCVNDFSEGLSIVYDDKLYAYNKEGDIVFSLDYVNDQVIPDQRHTIDEYSLSSPYFTQFADGLAPVTLDGDKWGYINQSGKFVIEPYFKEAGLVMNQTAAVCLIQSDSPSTLVNSRWGILNLKGVQ